MYKRQDIDWLLGHVPDNTDSAYFSNAEVERLKQEYIKHLDVITFTEELIISTSEHSARVEELEKKLELSHKEILSMSQDFKSALESVEQRMLERLYSSEYLQQEPSP